MNNDLQKFKSGFDTKFKQYLKLKSAHSSNLLNNSSLHSFVDQGIKIAIHSGKRVRPYLCRLMYESLNIKNNSAQIFPVLLGLELIHTFALIHDDIIDQSSLRHGIQTVHNFAKFKIEKFPNSKIVTHVANSQAILVGDLFLCWAYEAFQKYEKIIPQVTILMNELIAGQMLDVNFTVSKPANIGEIENRIKLKTSNYTFVHPLVIGARLGGGKKADMIFAKNFGLALGMGYQIQDDLLDIIGDSKKISKPLMGDIEENNQTHLTYFVFKHGTKKQKQFLKSILGNAVSATQRTEVVKLFVESGAVEYIQNLITKYFDNAEKILEKYSKNLTSDIDYWELLISTLRNRTY